MGIIQTIRGWITMLLGSKAKETYGVTAVTSSKLEAFVGQSGVIYEGNPPWAGKDIRTINMAKAVCSEVARLATLAIGIQADGGPRAEWIQQQIDENVYYNLRHWIEYAMAYGTAILKPTVDSVDLYLPGRFAVTDTAGGEITGVVFQDREYDQYAEKWYTRLEYHRFLDNGNYAVSNRCFVSDTESGNGKPCAIEITPWIGLLEDVEITGVVKPLFGVLRTPAANNIDIDSPLGLPIYADAIEELRDLDVAYTRNAHEIHDSRRMVLMDSDRLVASGTPVDKGAQEFELEREKLQLPEYVRMVHGDARESFYQEVNPSLNTDMRLKGINALLSQIGYKCGFSNGYFVFNESSGIATATQVEADQQRTVQLIKDVRDKLTDAIDGLVYALEKMADLYGLAPMGLVEMHYDFGDILYSATEDKARWYGYVVAGKVPFWYYLVKFEGLSEADAKALEDSAGPEEPEGLFGEE